MPKKKDFPKKIRLFRTATNLLGGVGGGEGIFMTFFLSQILVFFAGKLKNPKKHLFLRKWDLKEASNLKKQGGGVPVCQRHKYEAINPKKIERH